MRNAVGITIVIALFIVLVGLTSEAVSATETEADVILAQLVETSQAYDEADYGGFEAGSDELYAISIDEYVSAPCRAYAELGLATIRLFELAVRYPENTIFAGAAVEFSNTHLPIAANDCRLGL